MKKLPLPFFALVVIFMVLSCNEKQKDDKVVQKVSKPNVIYIMADDLGYGDLGCYGQKRIKTPNIDAMAREGMLFTNHYAGSTVCAPSRASLLTGLHQGNAPVRGNSNNVLSSDDFTIAELFQNNGYTTQLIGKWGLGEINTTGEPNKKGFDSYFGYLNQILAHNYYPDYLIKNGDSIALNNEIVKQTEGYAKGIGQAATKKATYSHDLFINETLDFLTSTHEKPFFLYLPLTIPHANNEGQLTAEHGMEVPDLGEYENENWPDVEKAKAAMISLLDTDIGRILAKLEEQKLSENTIVVFTSDNGPHKEGGVDPEFFDSNGSLRGIKRDLYEGGIRVPLIVQWKGKIKANSTSDLPAAFWDMMPTFADIMETELAYQTDGLSFYPTLRSQDSLQEIHKYLYWEFTEGDYDAQAIRSDKWKLLYTYSDDSWQLYDLEQDIGEQHNLYSEHPKVVEELKGYMKEAHSRNDHYPLIGE